MDRFIGFEAIPGVAARFYAWATEGRAILRDLFAEVEEAVATRRGVSDILDLGCGPGALALRLARRRPSCALAGVDLSPAMVRLARSRLRREGMEGRLRFAEGNATALPFPEASFDLVLSTLSLHHWRDRAGAMREIHRVLRPDGEAWIYDIRKDTPPAVERLARERYGRLASFLFLRLVRLHSFVTDAEARAVLAAASPPFRAGRLEEQGLFLRFVLER